MFLVQRIIVGTTGLLLWFTGFQEMEKKNSTRLSAMERNQAEINKRLDDVMKSNLNLQNMLETVIISLSGNEVVRDHHVIRKETPLTRETSPIGAGGDLRRNRDSGGLGCNEQCWDVLCRTSDDEDYANAGRGGKAVTKTESRRQVKSNKFSVNRSGFNPT